MPLQLVADQDHTRIILEHFDTFCEIYCGLPAVQSLNFDVNTRIVNSWNENSQ